MSGFGGNAEAIKRFLHRLHVDLDALRDGTEIMVIELLTFGRRGAEQCPAGQQQIGAHVGEVYVDQEIFLFGTAAGVRRRHLTLLDRDSTLVPASFMAALERIGGTFLSKASPVHETKTEGMHRVAPLAVSRM